MSSYPPHIVSTSSEFRLPWAQRINISSVRFGPAGAENLVACSGWDGAIHVYDIANPNEIHNCGFYFHGKPVLQCEFAGPHKIVSGGICRNLKVFDLESQKETVLGCHSNAIRKICYSDRLQLVASGGWDNALKLWDVRSNAGAVQTANCSDRVFAMDVNDETIIVGTRDRKVQLFDMRNLREPIQSRDSPLKYQTRSVAFFPDGKAFVIASIEGRVAIEYVDLSPEEQKKKYAFKCHRSKDSEGIELIYPVNALAFNPVHSSFATGGCDMMVNMWDPFNRKRLVQLHKFEASICDLSFSMNGTKLAIASTYMFEQEVDPNPMPISSVTIRSLGESDVRVKI